MFSTNPRPFTKRLFFLGQMDGPEPWDHQNLEISRIPLISVNSSILMELSQIPVILVDFGENHSSSDLEGSWRPHAEKVDIPIGILMFWRCPGPPRSQKNAGIH